nr:hypothetical protein [Natrinema saccharevitans]
MGGHVRDDVETVDAGEDESHSDDGRPIEALAEDGAPIDATPTIPSAAHVA